MFLVIFVSQKRYPLPAMKGDTMIVFDSEDEAIDFAEDNPIGTSSGYEVIEWDYVIRK